jgi:hypothetical protein
MVFHADTEIWTFKPPRTTRLKFAPDKHYSHIVPSRTRRYHSLNEMCILLPVRATEGCFFTDNKGVSFLLKFHPLD